MRQRIWLIAFAFLFASGAHQARADDQELCLCSADSCNYERENVEPGLRACTRMIQSGRYEGKNLAIIYRARGFWSHVKDDYAAALRDYDEAIHLDPKNPTGYDQRSDVRQAKGELDLALADVNTALSVDPTYAAAYYDRGNIYREKGDLFGARADYHAALAVTLGDNRTKYVQNLAREKLAEIVQTGLPGLEAIVTDDEKQPIFSGEWTGRLLNRSGQSRAESLELKEDSVGGVSGEWIGAAGDVSVSGIHGVSNSVVLTGYSDRGAIRIIATIEGDQIRLTYTAARPDGAGSSEGTSKLTRKGSGGQRVAADAAGVNGLATQYGIPRHNFPADVAESDDAVVCSNGVGDLAIAAARGKCANSRNIPAH